MKLSTKIAIVALVVILIPAMALLRYNALNYVPIQHQLARDAVSSHQTKSQYLAELSKYPLIFVYPDGNRPDEVCSQADHPFSIFPAYLSITVKFKDGKATEYKEAELGAAF